MPGAHGARTEGSAFLGHLLSALGQLVVGASAGGKKELIWNMGKATGGNQSNAAPRNSETPGESQQWFCFPKKCENQPISGYFCYSNARTTLNLRTQLQVTSDFERRVNKFGPRLSSWEAGQTRP